MPSAPEYYFVVRDQPYVSYLKKKNTLYHRKPLFLATIAVVRVTVSPIEGKVMTNHQLERVYQSVTCCFESSHSTNLTFWLIYSVKWRYCNSSRGKWKDLRMCFSRLQLQLGFLEGKKASNLTEHLALWQRDTSWKLRRSHLTQNFQNCICFWYYARA